MQRDAPVSRVESLSDGQRACLYLVADLMSSKRAQAILGVSTRADAAKQLVSHDKSLELQGESHCGNLVHQSPALARSRYARIPVGVDRSDETAVGGRVSAFEDRDAPYVPASYAFEGAAPAWWSQLAKGQIDNELPIYARLLLILVMMIALAVSTAVLVFWPRAFLG
jgi:hypothetical protein